MKNVKKVFVLVAFCFATISSSLVAENNKPIKNNENIITEITSLLGNEAPFLINETSKAEIVFTVNDANEMVIISINSESKEFRRYVNQRLNHKKLATKLKARTLYNLPVELKRL